MKVLVLQENLQKGLTSVGKIVSTKTQLPVLSNVLLKTEGGRLCLSSTNLETSISIWIGATIEEEGSLSVPARIFAEVVSTFPKDKVFLVSEGNTLRLQCGGSEVEIAGIDAQEFPPFPEIKKEAPLVLGTKLLQETLSFVQIAASQDESRPLLTGVRFVQKDGEREMVATDGFRLSVRKIPEGQGEGGSFLVSVKALQEVFRFLVDQKQEKVSLYFSQDKNQLLFVLPDTHVITRLIEGEYPPYEKIIPTSHTTRIIADRTQLLQAVKTAAIFAREASHIIRLSVNQNELLVSANSPQVGQNKTAVPVETEGEDGSIAFNARFLLDILSVFPEDMVAFEMTTPLAPGVFRSVKDPSYLHLIMPVRVQE